MKLLQNTHVSESPNNTDTNCVVAPGLTIKAMNLLGVWKESLTVYTSCKKSLCILPSIAGRYPETERFDGDLSLCEIDTHS